MIVQTVIRKRTGRDLERTRVSNRAPIDTAIVAKATRVYGERARGIVNGAGAIIGEGAVDHVNGTTAVTERDAAQSKCEVLQVDGLARIHHQDVNRIVAADRDRVPGAIDNQVNIDRRQGAAKSDRAIHSKADAAMIASRITVGNQSVGAFDGFAQRAQVVHVLIVGSAGDDEGATDGVRGRGRLQESEGQQRHRGEGERDSLHEAP